MKSFPNNLLGSAKELKKPRVLTTCAVMGALGIALKATVSIDLGGTASIGLSGLPNQVVDMLFGPVTGALFAAVMDVVKFAIKPSGAFHPGFTFDAMLAAFIYGCFYYKKPLRFWRVLAAKGLVELVVNLGFATLWLSGLYGKSFLALLPTRVGWSLVVNWPLNTAVFWIMARGMERAGVFRFFDKDAPAKP